MNLFPQKIIQILLKDKTILNGINKLDVSEDELFNGFDKLYEQGIINQNFKIEDKDDENNNIKFEDSDDSEMMQN